jgi:hypothetical protein
MIVALSVVFAPQKAEATVFGLINMTCWNGSPPSGNLGPHPTTGCTLMWGPGGLGLYANWSVLYACLSPNCVVTPSNFFRRVSLVNPPADLLHTYLARNCYGAPARIAVDGLARSYRININGGDILYQTEADLNGVIVPQFCPGSGAISAGPG